MTSSSRSVDTRVWLRGGLLLLGLAAAGNALRWWDLHRWLGHLPTLCVFHRLTGLDCPGCGMGRSLALLTHGEVLASLRQHPFGLPFVLWITCWALLPERLLARIEAHWLVRSNTGGVALVGLVLIWWVMTKVV